MVSFFDRMVLLAVCFFYMTSNESTSSVVIGLLGAFSVSCISYYVSNKKYSVLLWLVFFAASFFYTPLLYFLPLASYDFPPKKVIIPLLFTLIFLYHVYSVFDLNHVFLLFLFTILSYIMSLKTETLTQYTSDIFRHKDEREELKLVMEEKQRYLIENQEYEIHLATLKERNRIAREIHDTVGHVLSRSILMVGAIISSSKSGTAVQPLESLKQTLSYAMDTIRKSVHDLHDESIDLHAAFSSLAEGFSFCPVILDYDISTTVEKETKLCFLAIASEALSNIAKHSNASSAAIHLWEHPALYQLCIEDNGTGGTGMIEQRLVSSQGIGLENMADRVKALGGTISISQDRGFKIFASIPRGKAS